MGDGRDVREVNLFSLNPLRSFDIPFRLHPAQLLRLNKHNAAFHPLQLCLFILDLIGQTCVWVGFQKDRISVRERGKRETYRGPQKGELTFQIRSHRFAFQSLHLWHPESKKKTVRLSGMRRGELERKRRTVRASLDDLLLLANLGSDVLQVGGQLGQFVV